MRTQVEVNELLNKLVNNDNAYILYTLLNLPLVLVDIILDMLERGDVTINSNLAQHLTSEEAATNFIWKYSTDRTLFKPTKLLDASEYLRGVGYKKLIHNVERLPIARDFYIEYELVNDMDLTNYLDNTECANHASLLIKSYAGLRAVPIGADTNTRILFQRVLQNIFNFWYADGIVENFADLVFNSRKGVSFLNSNLGFKKWLNDYDYSTLFSKLYMEKLLVTLSTLDNSERFNYISSLINELYDNPLSESYISYTLNEFLCKVNLLHTTKKFFTDDYTVEERDKILELHEVANHIITMQTRYRQLMFYVEVYYTSKYSVQRIQTAPIM